MPYILHSKRDGLIQGSLMVGMRIQCPDNVGDLNYVISTIIDEYLSMRKFDYESINSVIGALECAKLELYRRIAAPYEDDKMQENGEVYFCYIPLDE